MTTKISNFVPQQNESKAKKYRIESRLYELFIRKGRIVLSFFLIFPCHAQQHTKNGTVVLPVQYFFPFQPKLQTEVKVSISIPPPFVAPFFLPPPLPHFDHEGHCRYFSCKKFREKKRNKSVKKTETKERRWNCEKTPEIKRPTNLSAPQFSSSDTLPQFFVIIVIVAAAAFPTPWPTKQKQAKNNFPGKK